MSSELAAFLRGIGVEMVLVQRPGALSFRVAARDLANVVPVMHRAEVVQVHMASPGLIELLIAAPVITPALIKSVQLLCDLFGQSRQERRQIKGERRRKELAGIRAETAKKEQEAAKAELEATKHHIETDQLRRVHAARIRLEDEQALTLRQAGFEEATLREHVLDLTAHGLDKLMAMVPTGQVVSMDLPESGHERVVLVTTGDGAFQRE